MQNEKDLIDKFGEFIDKQIQERDIMMLIHMPEGSMDPEIKSPFKDLSVVNFYIMLYAMEKVIREVINDAGVDPDKKDDAIDMIIDMIKHNLKEASNDH